jgi:hypothetical protein
LAPQLRRHPLGGTATPVPTHEERFLICFASWLTSPLHLILPLAAVAQEPIVTPGRIYDALEVTRGPLKVHAPRLNLPSGFELSAVRDTVIISFVVDTTGRVDATSIAIVRAGDSAVRTALVANEQESVYTPAFVGQTPVPVRLRRQFPMPPRRPVVRIPIASVRERVRALAGSGPFAVPAIHHRYKRREFCEGHPCGCNYGEWQANDPVPVFAAEKDTARITFQLERGEMFEGQPGYHHVLRPAVVIVFDTLRDYQHWFLPGDTLYLLQYVGELAYRVQHKDSVTEVHQFWAPQRLNGPKGALVQAGVEEWWVPIRTADARSGWIRPRNRALVRGPNAFCIPTADSTIW